MSAVKRLSPRSDSPEAHTTISFHMFAVNFCTSRSVTGTAPSMPLGKMAAISTRHLRAHRQAVPCSGCVPMALFLSLSRSSSSLSTSLASTISHLLFPVPLSGSFGRTSSSLPRLRPSSRLRRLPLPLRARLSLRAGGVRPRRVRLRLRWRFRCARLWLLDGVRGEGSSPVQSHTLFCKRSRRSRQSPNSGKVCMITDQLPRTQPLQRLASANTARLRKHRN
mmetsp:Transcript_36338/g.96598  ORF Transcript_36338/g.96598 Transcript_36338/m.96598 type:complete len:222 (-) Transcript_36338:660-1325(-)